MEDLKVLDLEVWKSEFPVDVCNYDKVREYLNFILEAVHNYDPARYSEWHHVIPRCIDKDHKYESEGIQVNGADHLRAHMILVECFNGQLKKKLGSAVSRMLGKSFVKDILPEEYEKARKLFAESQKGDNNPAKRPEVREKMSQSAKGKKLSLTCRAKIRKSLLGNQRAKGCSLSEEVRGMISARLVGNQYAKGKHWTLSEETRSKHCKENLSEDARSSYHQALLGNQHAKGKHWSLSKETRLNMKEAAKTRRYSVTCRVCLQKFISRGPGKGQTCPNCRSLNSAEFED